MGRRRRKGPLVPPADRTETQMAQIGQMVQRAPNADSRRLAPAADSKGNGLGIPIPVAGAHRRFIPRNYDWADDAGPAG